MVAQTRDVQIVGQLIIRMVRSGVSRVGFPADFRDAVRSCFLADVVFRVIAYATV